MSFEVVASEAVATDLMGGMTMDALVAGTVEAASVAAPIAEGAVAGSLAGGAADASVAGGALDTATAAAPAATETVGAGPSVASQADTQIDTLKQQILDGAPDTGSGAGASETTNAEKNFVSEAGAAAPKDGIVDRAMAIAEKHPVLAAAGATTVAGAVGGIGKAALEKEIAQRNIKARSDLLAQQYAETQQQSRVGALPGGGTQAAPSGRKVLVRPDGTPVFTAGSGIVNTQIG